MELISFLGKLFGYTPEIANVISGELRSVSEARRRPKVQQKNPRPAGRKRTFGVDTHPKFILGRGVPKLLQKLHIRKFLGIFRRII